MKRTRLFIGVAFIITAILVTYALSSAQALVGPITFDLEEQNASGENGTVTLTDLGAGKTQVEVTVSGQPSESSQPLQVHEGQCGPTLGRIVYPLNNIEGGKSKTTINASLASLTTENSSFAINSHKSEEEYTVYVLCGNIPSLATVAARATATQQALEAMQTRPPGGIPPLTFNLVAENESGQSGTVTLSDLGGGKTMVQVNVTGEPAGAIQPLHVHEGQCGPTLARLAYHLQDLIDGKSATTIEASLSSLTSEGFAFAINSHKSQKEYSIYVLCGNIPALGQTTGTGALPTAVIAVATSVAPTDPAATAAAVAPTATVAAPAATAVPNTATVAAPTATTVAPTATVAAPTAAAVVATATKVAPTATVGAPTAAAVVATATEAAPTATVVGPTAAAVVATATKVAPTATVAAPTAAAVVATATKVAPTAAAVVATATKVAPTTAVAAPTATTVAPTTAAVIATATKVAPTTAVVVATATKVAPTATVAAPTVAAVVVTATAVAPTSESAAATAVAPTADAAQATDVASTPAATGTATPAATIPESGGNPHSTSFLGLTMLGILVVAAGLSLMQFGERGSKGL